MLFPEPGSVPDFYARHLRVAPGTLIGTSILVGGLLVAALVAVVRGQRRKPIVGQEWLIGQVGEARTDLNPQGTVFVAGSWWTAEAVDGEVKAGEPIEVVGVQGLHLKVRRKTAEIGKG
jgi:membrane-bound serine protease (ClpP class)